MRPVEDTQVEPAHRLRDSQKNAGRPLLRLSSPWRLVTFATALTLILLAILTFQFLPSRYALNVGDVSPYDVKSPAKLSYVSQIRTTEERDRAAVAIADVYRPIPDAASRAQQAAGLAINQISQIRRDTLAPSAKADEIAHIGGTSLTPLLAGDVAAFDEGQWRETITTTVRLIDRNMRSRITAQTLPTTLAALPTQVDPGLDDREAAVATSLARSFLQPTDEVDATATAEARRVAAEAVQPVRLAVEPGETILRNGDIVTALDVEKLEAAGLRNPAVHWPDVLAMGLLALSLSGLVTGYLYRFQLALVASAPRLFLLAALLAAPILAAKLTIPGRELYAYLFPVAAAPMLLAILLDTQTSLLVTAVQAIAFAFVTNTGLELAAATLVAGGLGALTVHRMERINVLTRAVALVALGDLAVIAAFRLPNGDVDLQTFALLGFLALVGGTLSGALTLGTVSFLGHVFGIATSMNLLELAHPSQPLFRRLLTEAPGTYHHSVVVANLAERASAAVGADTLLARIGGYYHDIGKLHRPYAFVENQVEGQNVHDQLDPVSSARIILSHVPDGLGLAQKHGIPPRIQDMIAQHHGTMLVQYFYRQARQGTDAPIDEEAFRYAGPRPQTREAGIMMLADGVEAAVRASRDHSADSIAAIVDKIIQERIGDGDLDECDLTLSDIQKIRTAFLSVLQGIFHPRIEYPVPAIAEPHVVGKSP